MQTLTVADRTVPLNPKGFLSRFEDWDENVAKQMAEQENLELQDCHWAAIRFIREYYQTYQVPPNPRALIKEVGEKLHAYRCTRTTLKEVFPDGGCKQACRLAVLPDYYCHAC